MKNAELEEKTIPIYKLTIRWGVGHDAVIFQEFFDNIPPNSAKLRELIYIRSQIMGGSEVAEKVVYCLENIVGIDVIIKKFPESGGATQFLWHEPETGNFLGSIQLTKLLVIKTKSYQD